MVYSLDFISFCRALPNASSNKLISSATPSFSPRCSRYRARHGTRSPQRCPRSYSTGSSAGTPPAWRRIGRSFGEALRNFLPVRDTRTAGLTPLLASRSRFSRTSANAARSINSLAGIIKRAVVGGPILLAGANPAKWCRANSPRTPRVPERKHDERRSY
jgi:hypothetical protein